jgi:hypothetical protein
MQLDENGTDAGVAWGLLEATATTPRRHGPGAGATGLGVADRCSEQPGGFEQVSTGPTDLRKFYLDYDSGTGEGAAILGRRVFPAKPVVDVDSQQGVGVSLIF